MVRGPYQALETEIVGPRIVLASAPADQICRQKLRHRKGDRSLSLSPNQAFKP